MLRNYSGTPLYLFNKFLANRDTSFYFLWIRLLHHSFKSPITEINNIQPGKRTRSQVCFSHLKTVWHHRIESRVELLLGVVRAVTPQLQGLLTIRLNDLYLVKGQVLLPVVGRRLGVTESGTDSAHVGFGVRVQERLDLVMHGEIEEFEDSFAVRVRLLGKVLVPEDPAKITKNNEIQFF